MNPQVGAASTHVHDLLTGPPRPGTARRVGPDRAAVEVAGRLVVLVRAAGPRTLPCSVVVPRLDPALFDGEPAIVGDGRVVLSDHTVTVVRWWEPTRVRAGAGAEPLAEQPTARVLDGDTRHALQEGAGALVAGDLDAASDRLMSVLGRGRGSTPDADDAVAGLLLAARALATPSRLADVEALATRVAQCAPARTTVLSAELLRAAALGYAASVLVRHLASPSADSAAQVERLGATSGRATLQGVSVLHQAWRGAREAVAA
ncbi:MAG: oxamate carbamoyltransferase subunit AllH family protein [Angustibacter sp.]